LYCSDCVVLPCTGFTACMTMHCTAVNGWLTQYGSRVSLYCHVRQVTALYCMHDVAVFTAVIDWLPEHGAQVSCFITALCISPTVGQQSFLYGPMLRPFACKPAGH
jgi:hypothetical protein